MGLPLRRSLILCTELVFGPIELSASNSDASGAGEDLLVFTTLQRSKLYEVFGLRSWGTADSALHEICVPIVQMMEVLR